MDFKIGQNISGRISGVQDYGVFLLMDEKNQGLVHISECSEDRIGDIHEDFKIGELKDVTVLDVDDYSGGVSLSFRQNDIKKVKAVSEDEKPQFKGRKHFWTRNKIEIGFKTIADNLDEMKSEAINRISKKIS